MRRDLAALVVALVLGAVTPGPDSYAGAKKPVQTAIVQGVGTVTAVDPKAHQLTINHEEIKGYMEAMEMGYPVAKPALLQRVKPGDKVKFSINRRKGLIVDLAVMEHGQAQAR